ncbi:hypothetical protein AALA24_13675 [Anaerovoracaceae bacterium 42-11]
MKKGESAERTGVSGGEQQKEILVCIEHESSEDGAHKRKTDTQRIL